MSWIAREFRGFWKYPKNLGPHPLHQCASFSKLTFRKWSSHDLGSVSLRAITLPRGQVCLCLAARKFGCILLCFDQFFQFWSKSYSYPINLLAFKDMISVDIPTVICRESNVAFLPLTLYRRMKCGVSGLSQIFWICAPTRMILSLWLLFLTIYVVTNPVWFVFIFIFSYYSVCMCEYRTIIKKKKSTCKDGLQ